ncbi:hypothetical protein [Streptacidiphilus albus]|uniref:hypothetical protein n=1 Tax=Streptacidiphilus albus TaxID=105425 RepID=UPI00054C1F37|nr:hypothetical protein [Streptacidiphilus albus]
MSDAPTSPKASLTRTINTIQRALFAAVLALTGIGAVCALRNQLLTVYLMLAVVVGLLWLQTVVMRLPTQINSVAEQHGIPPVLPNPSAVRR